MKFSDYKEDILKGVPVFFQLFGPHAARIILVAFNNFFYLFFSIRGMS